MKKKITALCLAVAMLAVAVIGGTLAYFTDTDEAKNVFTVGSVKIEIEEPNWDPNEQSKKMENIVPGISYEKDPQVKNTGKNDAYVRMTVCFQNGVSIGGTAGESLTDLFKNLSSDWTFVSDGLSIGGAGHINGHTNCWYATFNYNKILKAGETTAPLFTAVKIPSTWTQEQFESFIGNEFEVVVSAEAIQADGFDTAVEAFAVLDNNGADIVTVTTTEELADALKTGEKVIKIDGQVEFTAAQAGAVTDMKGVTLLGADADASLTIKGTGGGLSNINMVNIILIDETAYASENGENAWEFTYLEFDGNNSFNNVTFTDGVIIEGGHSDFVNCSFEGHNNDSSDLGNTTMYGAWVYSGSATFTDCTFFGTRGLKVADQYSGSDVTDVVVDNCFFGPLSEKPGLAVDNRIGNLNLVIKNSTFVGTQAGDAATDATKGVPYIYENDNRTPDTTTITLINNIVAEKATNAADLKAALAAGKVVVLEDDITAPTETGYGAAAKTGVKLNGGVIDGNGNTLSTTNATGTWDSVIYTTGGTIKNMTVTGAFRGILTGGLTEDLIVDNVVIDGNGICYTVQADGSTRSAYKLVVTNSTLNGWTSYSDIFASVEFTNCKFGKNDGGYGYAYCRPYNNTTFTDCVFSEGFEFDATKCTSTFVNCYVGGTLITAENVVSLLGADAANIVVKN